MVIPTKARMLSSCMMDECEEMFELLRLVRKMMMSKLLCVL